MARNCLVLLIFLKFYVLFFKGLIYLYGRTLRRPQAVAIFARRAMFFSQYIFTAFVNHSRYVDDETGEGRREKKGFLLEKKKYYIRYNIIRNYGTQCTYILYII